MAAAHYAAHQQQHRYNSTSDVTLPPITSLNFPSHSHSQRPPPPLAPDSELAHTNGAYRSRPQWSSRPPYTHPTTSSPTTLTQHHHHPQQLHTPPLSAGPEHAPGKPNEYAQPSHHSKQDENNAYPAPAVAAISGPGDDGRQRTLSNGTPLSSGRPQSSHVGYPSYHATQTTVSQPTNLYHPTPPPSAQEQIHRSSGPVHTHTFPGYVQQTYMSTQRPPQTTPLPALQNQGSPSHHVPYPSPIVPAQADRWEHPQQIVNHLPPPHQLQTQPTHGHPTVPPTPTQQEQAVSVQVSPPAQHSHQTDQQPPYMRNTTTRIQSQQGSSYTNKQEVPPAKRDTMTQVVELCSMLYDFASRFAQLQATRAEVRPTQTELAEMARRAHEVVRLLEDLHRIYIPENERTSTGDVGGHDENRPPKRPWEDMSKDGDAAEGPGSHEHYNGGGAKAQEEIQADRDMDEIRMKRANSNATANGGNGHLKSKYRKRSRASPPGKCHSCNIRETPEWRRGPDGARTLCNACGLHYAKLVRKKMQHQPPGAPPPRIDMETLRASARAADLEKSIRGKHHSRSSSSSSLGAKAIGQGTNGIHQGSFQVVTMPPPSVAPPTPLTGTTTPSPSESAHGTVSNVLQSPHTNVHQNHAPWQSSPSLQHQSFMRTAQHNTSAR